MTAPLTAQDLVPIVAQLSRDEQVRLAKIALRAADADADAEVGAYRTLTVAPDEFTSDDDPLAWEGEGWEGVDASR